MKAFLLAAGKGERLRPLTINVPKCLVSIQGTPLLGIWLDLCRRHRIDEVLVNTHSHPEQLVSYLNEHSYGLRVDIRHEETLLGSAGTLLANRNWIGGDRDFWIFYADILTNANITQMLEFHRSTKPAATMGVCRVGNPRESGIVTVDEKHVVQDFVEKPEHPSSDLAFAGILAATPAIFGAIPNQIPADIAFDVFPKLIGRMAAYPIHDYLVDIGTPAKYYYAQVSWPGIGTSAC